MSEAVEIILATFEEIHAGRGNHCASAEHPVIKKYLEKITLRRTTTLGKASVITYTCSGPESFVKWTLTYLFILQQTLGAPRCKHGWILPPTRKSSNSSGKPFRLAKAAYKEAKVHSNSYTRHSLADMLHGCMYEILGWREVHLQQSQDVCSFLCP